MNTFTGRSHFMLGLFSWKTLHKSNPEFPFKRCISWGLGDWQPHPIQCTRHVQKGTELFK